MIDQVALVGSAAKTAGSYALKKYLLSRFPDPNTPKFEEARDEMWREWVVEEKNATAEAFADLILRVRDLDEKVDARADSAEAHGVYANYAEQAYREPIAERRRMLAHASAAIIDVRLTIAEHARVQRRIDELEPEDIMTLYALSRTYGYFAKGKNHGNERRLRLAFVQELGGGEALRAAGCIDIRPGPPSGTNPVTPEGLDITDFGRLVLRVFRTYCRATEIPFVIPGREVHRDERGRDKAFALLDAAGPIRKELPGFVLPRPAEACRYMAPTWTARHEHQDALPPLPTAAAIVEVSELTEDEARQIEGCFAEHADPPMPGGPTERLGAYAQRQSDGTWCARIFGPHDVLRHLADELDIRWF